MDYVISLFLFDNKLKYINRKIFLNKLTNKETFDNNFEVSSATYLSVGN